MGCPVPLRGFAQRWRLPELDGAARLKQRNESLDVKDADVPTVTKARQIFQRRDGGGAAVQRNSAKMRTDQQIYLAQHTTAKRILPTS